LDVFGRDKGGLERRNEMVKEKLKFVGQNFGYDLINDVTKTDRSKVVD
jgi:hypothetical protein